MTIFLKALVIIGSLTAAPSRPDQASDSFHDAIAASARCETANNWAERTVEGWLPVCGSDEGDGADLLPNSCEEYAGLRYAMAESAGRDADDAYETAIAECHAAPAKRAH